MTIFRAIFKANSKLVLLVSLPPLLLLAGQIATAQTETVLYRFCSQPNCADGQYPRTGVIMDAEGNLYGTTFAGGIGLGVLFELSATGTESVLYAFSGEADGAVPSGGLIQDANNNLYGTTLQGGSHARPCKSWGCGVVFQLAPTGAENVLYFFEGEGDGVYPGGDLGFGGNLVFDTAGNLFGTTQNAFSRSPHEGGVVFKLAPDGSETVLHTFPAYKGDGRDPNGFLLFDAQGNLYGTTSEGGHGGSYGPHVPCTKGCGTIFKISSSGEETVLYAFKGYGHNDGAFPSISIMDAQGNLYGEASGGGRYGYGTIFEVTPSGEEKQLYSFTGVKDGNGPNGWLIQDEQGNFYGTAVGGGAYGDGTVFELTASGTLKVLYSFAGGSDGEGPIGLFRDANGNFYGTTQIGGTASSYCYTGCGVVFKVTP